MLARGLRGLRRHGRRQDRLGRDDGPAGAQDRRPDRLLRQRPEDLDPGRGRWPGRRPPARPASCSRTRPRRTPCWPGRWTPRAWGRSPPRTRPSTQLGGTLQALRSDKQASEAVSTVDDVDQPMGLVTLVLALREQLTGAAGQYGVGPGALKIAPTTRCREPRTASPARSAAAAAALARRGLGERPPGGAESLGPAEPPRRAGHAARGTGVRRGRAGRDGARPRGHRRAPVRPPRSRPRPPPRSAATTTWPAAPRAAGWGAT